MVYYSKPNLLCKQAPDDSPRECLLACVHEEVLGQLSAGDVYRCVRCGTFYYDEDDLQEEGE
jgi:hypothetical protein